MKTLTIPSHSVLAILDRELRAKDIKPKYIWNVYFDTITRKKGAGLLLHSFEGHHHSFDMKFVDLIGVLGFVNAQEPAEGTLPLHEVVPRKGDVISVAYIIEGIYKGDFKGISVNGLDLVHSYTVEEKDLEEKPYEISVIETEVYLKKEDY